MLRRSACAESDGTMAVRIVQFPVHADMQASSSSQASREDCQELYVVLFPAPKFPLAKQFWQHTGLGISSRYAERCLSYVIEPHTPSPASIPGLCSKHAQGGNRHYAKRHSLRSPQDDKLHSKAFEDLNETHATYLEERYGRNMPLSHGAIAKRTLRRRIAGVLIHDPDDSLQNFPSKHGGTSAEEVGWSSRGVRSLTEDDVYLFPTGMSAIWTAHQLVLRTMPPATKSVCFG